MTNEQRAKIDAMDHLELCRYWRFAEDGDPLLQGDAGDYFRDRLFIDHGGFTPEISKILGWGR